MLAHRFPTFSPPPSLSGLYRGSLLAPLRAHFCLRHTYSQEIGWHINDIDTKTPDGGQLCIVYPTNYWVTTTYMYAYAIAKVYPPACKLSLSPC